MRELAKLEAFDFVPPFRGRAVHMLERKKPFEELGIDFEEQQRRKDAEYAKLGRMVRYATTAELPATRNSRLLWRSRRPGVRHLRQLPQNKVAQQGERGPSGPGTPQSASAVTNTATASGGRQPPSNPPSPQSSPPTDEKILDAVRIVLSGVARMKGRYGKQMVARMLVGSQAKELQKYRLNTLSTYGLLSSLSEPQTVALIDAMLAARLLQQVEERPHRPLLRLTDQGEEVMKGAATINERLPIDKQLLSSIAVAAVAHCTEADQQRATSAGPQTYR